MSWRSVGTLALALTLLAPAAPASEARRTDRDARDAGRARAGDDLTIADLDWPATTRSVRTRGATKAYAGPRKRGGRIGKIAAAQHVAFGRIVKTSDRCRAWIEVAPRGWVCARDVEPSDAPPAATAVPRKVRTGTSWVGMDLRTEAPPAWPFAWALEPQRWRRRDQGKKLRPPRPTPVLAAPEADAEVVRELAPRTAVAVREADGDFVRIADGEWVAARELRVITPAARPAGVGEDEKWIDVDLAAQVLVAYEGDTPVYATLVSTGRRNGTPTGIYRITIKQAVATMRDAQGPDTRWNHPDVPFVMRFRERYALHGAYWHDRFGNAQSVGCVNLAPEDARWLFAWTTPVAPIGWLQWIVRDDTGTVVRIHGPDDPDPVWRDYDGAPRGR